MEGRVSGRWAGALALAVVLSAGEQTLPTTGFATLAGGKLTLPEAGEGKVELLVVGFTHASKEPTSAWGKAMSADCAAQTGLVCYQIAVLEDVPHLVRGMVTGSMKRETSPEKRDRFLLLFHDEKAWKALAGFSEPDTAYLILVNGKGAVIWKTSGAPEKGREAEVKEQIRRALAR